MLSSYIKKLSILILLVIGVPTDIKAATNFINNLPPTNKFFTGRKDEIDFIKNHLNSKKQLIALTGSAGIGKTQIAKEYVSLYSKNYDIISWIDAEKSIPMQLKNLIKEWNSKSQAMHEDHIYIHETDDETTIQRLKDSLSKTRLNWLLVFDNVANKNEINNYIQMEGGNIIITTKNKLGWRYMQTIEKFHRVESIELLSKLIDNPNREELNNLSSTLNDYPLALAQAGSFIRMNPSISVQKYIELYQRERQRLWEYENKFFKKTGASLLDEYKHTVKTTIDISLAKVREESKKAFDLANVLAFLSSENIPENMLREYFKGDELEMASALALLMSYSLVDIKSKDLEKTYVIHEIAQLAIHDSISEPQKVAVIKVVMRDLNKIIPTQLDRLLPLISKKFFILNQINKICEYGEKHKVYNNDLLDLNIRRLEYVINGERDEKTSGKLISNVTNLMNKVNDVSNMTKIRLQFAKASYQALAFTNTSDSIKTIELALNLLREYPNAYEEYLMAYNRLALLYMAQGDIDEALRYSELGKGIVGRAKGFLGNQDAFYGIRGRILEDLGDYQNAFKNIEMSEIQAQKVEDKDYQTVITTDALFVLVKI